MKFVTYDRHKGMNRFNDQLNMKPDWLWDIQNGYIDKENNIQQRNGFAKYNTDAITGTPAIRYMTECKFTNGDVRMICRAGTAWWKEDGDAVWDSLDGTRTSDAQGMAVVWNSGGTDTVIMVDGGAPRKCVYTSSFGSPANLGGTCPTDATAVHIHNKHVILNSTAKPQYVYVSALADAEDYTTSNDALTLDLGPYLSGGDTVIGFSTFQEDFLVIYCKRFIVVYNAPYDTVNWNLQQVIPTGAVTAYATGIDPRSGLIFVPGIEGVNLLGSSVGSNIPQDPFKSIAPLYRSDLTSVTSTSWKYICGCVSRKLNHYYINMPLSGGHELFVYSFDLNAVVGRYTGHTMWCMCERMDGTILFGGASGRAYTFNSGTTDDGVAITFSVTTPYYDFGSGLTYKTIREVAVNLGYTVAHTFKLDYGWDTQGAKTQITQAITTNARNRYTFSEEGLKGRGRACYFQFTNATSTAIINIPSYSIGYVEEGLK